MRTTPHLRGALSRPLAASAAALPGAGTARWDRTGLRPPNAGIVAERTFCRAALRCRGGADLGTDDESDGSSPDEAAYEADPEAEVQDQEEERERTDKGSRGARHLARLARERKAPDEPNLYGYLTELYSSLRFATLDSGLKHMVITTTLLHYARRKSSRPRIEPLRKGRRLRRA